MKLLEMKSTGLNWDDKEPIRQWYDLKYKHITNQSSSYLNQELNSVKHFVCIHAWNCENGLCTWYKKKYFVLCISTY